MGLLRAFTTLSRKSLPPPVSETMLLGVDEVAITFRRHATARRFTLRLARTAESFIMTMPRRASMAEARAFAVKSQSWMLKSLARRAKPRTTADGMVIMLRGIEHRVSAMGKVRGLVTHDREACIIHVPGQPHHMHRRLVDWLKAEAAHDLDVASTKYAGAMGVTFRKLNVRDQKSRWGSCSSGGVLSYSWRLILAPAVVLDYVAAHEVAHLQEMNHSTRFWRLVLRHCPTSKDGRTWLRLYGATLHSIA